MIAALFLAIFSLNLNIHVAGNILESVRSYTSFKEVYFCDVFSDGGRGQNFAGGNNSFFLLTPPLR